MLKLKPDTLNTYLFNCLHYTRVIMLSDQNLYAECYYAKCHQTECQGTIFVHYIRRFKHSGKSLNFSYSVFEFLYKRIEIYRLITHRFLYICGFLKLQQLRKVFGVLCYTHTHTHTHTYTYIYIYLYIFVCVFCLCVCVLHTHNDTYLTVDMYTQGDTCKCK